MVPIRHDWEHLPDDDLLATRICDLKVRIAGSELEPRIEQLRDELKAREILLQPVFYLSDEWQSPDGQAAVGIPFYLAHPRLKALEFRMMFDVEGGTASSCMRLLRHEAGHAFDHAFGLSKKPEFRRAFGDPKKEYTPYFYYVDPESKRFVRNVPNNYAQCHPIEDFAETFAVWLNPGSQWRTRYRGWPAMRKLLYMERAARKLDGKLPRRREVVRQAEARTLQSTLRGYYERKFRNYQREDLGFAAKPLREIFRPSRAAAAGDAAAAFLRRYRRRIIDAVIAYSGEKESRVENLIDGLVAACEEQRLVLRDGVDVTLLRFSTFLTTLVVNRLRTLSYRGSRP